MPHSPSNPLPVGTRIGSRTIIGPLIRGRKYGRPFYKYPCRCDCGQVAAVSASLLHKGQSGSCVTCALRAQFPKYTPYSRKITLSIFDVDDYNPSRTTA